MIKMSNKIHKIYNFIILALMVSTILPFQLFYSGIFVSNTVSTPKSFKETTNQGINTNYNYETYNKTGKFYESVNINVDRYGNLTFDGIFNWTNLDFGLDLSLPQYNGKYAVFFIVQKHLDKYDLFDYYDLPKPDYFIGIATSSLISPKIALDHCNILIKDFENAFGIPKVNYLGKFPFQSRGTFPYNPKNYNSNLMTYIFGNNFSGLINFDYFFSKFKNDVPHGLSDIFSQNAINSASKADLQWIILNNAGKPVQKMTTIHMDYTNFFNFGTLNNFTLDIFDVLNLSKISAASQGIANELYSTIMLYLENCGVQNFSYQNNKFVDFDEPSKLTYTLLDYEPSWRGIGELKELKVNFSNPINDIRLLSPNSEINTSIPIRVKFTNPKKVDSLELNVWKPKDFYINQNVWSKFNNIPPEAKFSLSNVYDFSNFNDDSKDVLYFDACLDSHNNIHVVYSKRVKPTTFDVFYQKFNGTNWEVVQITNNTFNDTFVAIATDSLDNVHIAFTEENPTETIMYVNNTNGNFGVPIAISHGINNKFPILLNSGTSIYAIWSNGTNINYRGIFLGGILGSIVNITNMNNLMAISADLDSSMVFHLLAVNFSSPYRFCYLNYSMISGKTSEIKILNEFTDSRYSTYGYIKIDSNNNKHIIYSGENDDIQYFNISSSGIWSNKNNITNNGNKTSDFACSIAIDITGNILISYLEQNTEILSFIYNVSSSVKKEIYMHECTQPNYTKLLIDSHNNGHLISMTSVNKSIMHKGVVYQMTNDTWFSSMLNKVNFYNIPNGNYIFEIKLYSQGYSQEITKEIKINYNVSLQAEILNPVEGYISKKHFELINITINVTSGPVNISTIKVYSYTWLQLNYLYGIRKFVSNWSTINETNLKPSVIYRFQWSTDWLFQTGNYTIVVVIFDRNNVSLVLEREIYIKANGIGINDPKNGDLISGVKQLSAVSYVASGCTLYGAGFPLLGQFFISVLRLDNLDPYVPETYQEIYVTGIGAGSLRGDLISSDLQNGEYLLLPSTLITDGADWLILEYWENTTIINVSNPTPITINHGSNWSNVQNIFMLNFTLSGSTNLGPEYTPYMSYSIYDPDKYVPNLHQSSLNLLYMGVPFAPAFLSAEHTGGLKWNNTKSIWEVNRTFQFMSSNDSGWATYNIEDQDYILTITRYTNNTFWGGLGGMGNFEFISPDTYITTNNPEKLKCYILTPSDNQTIENTLILNVSFSHPYNHYVGADSVSAYIFIYNGTNNPAQLITYDTLNYNPITDTYNGIITIGNISNQYLQIKVYGTINETDFKNVGIMNYTFIRSKYSPDGIPPNPPSDFNATAKPDGSVLLEWTNSTSPDVDRFIILRNSTEKNPYILKILPASDLSFVDFNVIEGTRYRYWILAMDNSSLISTRLNASEIPDSTPPIIQLLSPINNQYYNKYLLINASIIENIHKIDVVCAKIWNETWNSKYLFLRNTSNIYYMNDTFDTSLYSDGLYNLTLYANDTIGNINTQLISLYFDNSVPDIQEIYSPKKNKAYHANLTITTLITDLAGVYDVWAYVTNETYNATVILSRIGLTNIWTGIWENITGQLYTDGAYNISILANDVLGNGINRTLNRSFFIDSNIPYISEPIYSPINGFYYKDKVLINVSASDPNGISKVWCEISNKSGHIENVTLIHQVGDIYNANWSTLGLINDGEYHLVIYANDSTNSLAQSSTYIIFIDNTPPAIVEVSRVTDNWTITHDSLLGDSEFRDKIQIFGSYFEQNIYAVEFYNGSTLIGTNYTGTTTRATLKWNIVGLNGLAKLKIKVIDIAGNSNMSTIQKFDVNIDNIAPNGTKILNIIDMAGHNYNNSDKYFNGTLTFICQFDNEIYPSIAELFDQNDILLSSTTTFIGNKFNITWVSNSFNGKKQFYLVLNDTTDHSDKSNIFPNVSIYLDNTYPVITNLEIIDSDGHYLSKGDTNFCSYLTIRASWIETNPILIEFYIGTNLIDSISDPSGGFTQVVDWDSKQISDNFYTVKVVLLDIVGQKKIMSQQITIDNNDPISISTTSNILSGNQIVISGYSDDRNGSGIATAQILGGNASTYYPSTILSISDVWNFTNSTHIPDGTYILTIKILDNIGHFNIISIRFRVDNIIPLAPTNLDYSLSGNLINLTWDYSTSSDIQYYKIYRNNQLISMVDYSTNFYVDGPLISGTYSYTIIAVDEAGHESKVSTSMVAIIPTPASSIIDYMSLIIGLIVGIAIMLPIALLLSKKKKKQLKKPEKQIKKSKLSSNTPASSTPSSEIKPIPIPKQYVCANCGADIPPGGSVCVKCGSKLIIEKK